jgi:preprotein translocase subunit SecD
VFAIIQIVMLKKRISAIALLVIGVALGFFVHYSELPGNGFISKFPFKLGLDLSGGTHLVYQADTSKIPASDVAGAMESLKMVIESRINAFGVAEPIIQTEKGTAGGVQIQKLIVELPGVTDVNKAVDLIGKTPVLEFKTEKTAGSVPANSNATATDAFAIQYETSPLTGRFLESARVEFDPNTRQPLVALSFNEEGKKLFGQLTTANIGKTIAIFLDGWNDSHSYRRNGRRDQARFGSYILSGFKWQQDCDPGSMENLLQGNLSG